MRLPGIRTVVGVCLVWIGGLVAPAVADAATCDWVGAGANTLWSTPANWNCDGVGLVPASGDVIQFLGGGSPLSENDIASLEVVRIFIGGVGAGNVRYRITGLPIAIDERLTLAAGADGAGAGPEFLAPLHTMGASYIEQIGGGGAPVTLGDIVLADNAVLDISTTSADITVTGTVSGAGGLRKLLNERLVLAGDNTYAGQTLVAAGTVMALGADALGADGPGNETILGAGATLRVASGLTINEALQISGPGVNGLGALQVEGAGIVTLTGNVVLAGVADVGSAIGTLTITGPITPFNPASQLRLAGGTLRLGNAANAWGAFTILGGSAIVDVPGAFPAASALNLAAATSFETHGNVASIGTLNGGGEIVLGGETLTINQTTTGSFTGAFSGTGAVVKAGAAALTLDGADTNGFTGLTTVTAGVLKLSKTDPARAISGPLRIAAGSVEVVQGTPFAPAVPVTIEAPGTLMIDPVSSADIGMLSGDGALTLGNGSILQVGAEHASGAFAGTITGGANGSVYKLGLGTWTLSGDSTAYNGLIRVTAGTLIVDGHTGTLTGNSRFGGSGTIQSLSAFTGAEVAPGAPNGGTGILTTTAAAVAAGVTLSVELNGTTAGSGYDQLSGTTVSMHNAVLQATLGFTPATGDTFTIVKQTDTQPWRFAGLPQDAVLLAGGRAFRISYTGGDGNDVTLTALEPFAFSISDVTLTEPASGAANAVFTVSLPRPALQTVTVQYGTEDVTASGSQDYTPISGTLTFLPGAQTQTVTVAVHGDTLDEPDESFLVRLSNPQGGATIADAEGLGTIANAAALTWYLAEGATGDFFDTDVLIANVTTTPAPVTLTFFKEDGSTVVESRTIAAQSRATVHVDQIAGLEATAASIKVTSDRGVPLVVERTMFWDASYYGGHTGTAVDAPATTWYFAEAAQGFFNTFVLVTNANASPATVTLTFLRENAAPFVTTMPIGATSRLTVDASTFSELQGGAFGLIVEATQPVIAERSMYFGSTPAQLWTGGHESPGVTSPSPTWFIAEGATGGFFDTFILLSNPQDVDAQVTLDYLLDSGETIAVQKMVPAKGRLTIPLEAEADERLHAGAVSAVINADRPIVAERSTYWAAGTSTYGEGHNSFGLTQTATAWGLAEGRVGGEHHFATFILLANPQAMAADVTITYLRENGTAVTKRYTVPANSRSTIGVHAEVPELQNESFGARIAVTNGQAIAVERSMYWDANGIFWAGGSHAPATLLR